MCLADREATKKNKCFTGHTVLGTLCAYEIADGCVCIKWLTCAEKYNKYYSIDIKLVEPCQLQYILYTKRFLYFTVHTTMLDITSFYAFGNTRTTSIVQPYQTMMKNQ